MMYDLIEVTPKMNKKKVILITVIAIFVITICICAGIYFAKQVHKDDKENTINENAIKQNEVEDVKVSNKKNKLKHIAKVNMNPTYTEIRTRVDGKHI